MANYEGSLHSMGELLQELYPICRSITGNGVRQTLEIIARVLPELRMHEVPSGTRVFDWIIPPEWNIQDAYLENESGERLIDFKNQNLHVVSYSTAIDRQLTWQELIPKLYSLPQKPTWIPYRTSYYKRDWGICLTHQQLQTLDQESQYRVRIDSQLNEHGSLSYGELFLPGRLRDEFIFSAHICHPSMANDNLSAIVVAMLLASKLAQKSRRYSYRFLFAPGTIGCLTWLAQNRRAWSSIRGGLVLALLGDSNPLTYKRSRHAMSRIDLLVQDHLTKHDEQGRILSFAPTGYDERQFGSQEINLPVGRLTRSQEGEYQEYHSSGDNLSFIKPEALTNSLCFLEGILDSLESDRVYRSVVTTGEVQLGRHGLYDLPVGSSGICSSEQRLAIQWTLNLANGQLGLQQIATCSRLPLETHAKAADLLLDHQLIEETDSLNQNKPINHGSLKSIPKPSSVALALSAHAHDVIPGGCHTYAKGDDQYPENAPRFIESGRGCHVYDSDGNRFIEYGMGLRSVGLGHAYPAVCQAAARQMLLGSNFTRPATIELQAAEALREIIPNAEMVKFTKNGSDATTAAVKLARAFTGRDRVVICREHPFFSTDDWFIGTTPMNAGIPDAIRELTTFFAYNQIESLLEQFRKFPNQISCVILEAATTSEPEGNFLIEVQEICRSEGAVLVLDEMITGFRWHLGGAQAEYGIIPDLSTFGKALGNGFAVAALTGRREIMQLGGLQHADPRVFLLSSTHGAETLALAAAMENIAIYRSEPVIEALYRQGRRLRDGLQSIIRDLCLENHFLVLGRDCNLVFATLDQQLNRSQAFRTLVLQELIRRGVLAPSLVVSYSHTDADIDYTISAFAEALEVYKLALRHGVEMYLEGRPSKPVFRQFN
ncbi:MAG: glutamate-1-semialdehyde 2,1-aminomutase [Planctomycetales bacterium]|nr:glutamate-1-semialdehyde 2,1-aminomutase [Planctomycetales bacterium]